jgi:hypothetical protein
MPEKVVCPNKDKCGEDKNGCGHHQPHEKCDNCELICYKNGVKYNDCCVEEK